MAAIFGPDFREQCVAYLVFSSDFVLNWCAVN